MLRLLGAKIQMLLHLLHRLDGVVAAVAERDCLGRSLFNPARRKKSAGRCRKPNHRFGILRARGNQTVQQRSRSYVYVERRALLEVTSKNAFVALAGFRPGDLYCERGEARHIFRAHFQRVCAGGEAAEREGAGQIALGLCHNFAAGSFSQREFESSVFC